MKGLEEKDIEEMVSKWRSEKTLTASKLYDKALEPEINTNNILIVKKFHFALNNLATETQRHREKNKGIFQVSAPHFHVKIQYEKRLCVSEPPP